MSVRTVTRVWEYSKQSSTDLLLLLAIADHADDDGICWPGIPRLAQKTRTSERQTIRNVEKLAQSGELFLSRQCGRGNSNLYFITVGLNQDEIIKVLQSRFELGHEAIQIAESLTSVTLKGDIGDRVYQEKKVTSRATKGDIGDKKVTSVTLKGDIAMSPEPSYNRHDNRHKNQQEFGPLTQVLLSVCKLDFELISPSTGKELVRIQKALYQKNAQPDQILDFEEWRIAYHWSGKSTATLKIIGDCWPQYLDWIEQGRPAPISQNGATNGHRPITQQTQQIQTGQTVDQTGTPPPGYRAGQAENENQQRGSLSEVSRGLSAALKARARTGGGGT